ncbi:MAG: MFS transporter, partial [Nitrospinota bacterium]
MRRKRSRQAKPWQLLLFLMTCIVLFVTTIGMLGPLLVDLATTFRISVAQAGQLATITAFPWALTSLITGWLSDRYGRKPLLSISLLGIGTCSTLAALAPNFATLALLRILTGMVGGAGPVALMATVGDHFAPVERGRAMGWVNAGFGIATVAIIPLVGAIAGAWGWRWSFLTVGGMAFFLAGGAWWWLPATASHLRPGR